MFAGPVIRRAFLLETPVRCCHQTSFNFPLLIEGETQTGVKIHHFSDDSRQS